MKESDVELIQRILNGDDSAFTVLVKRYQKWVHALAWRKIGDFHIAEEITQDIFLKVYEKLSTLKSPYNFPGWLYVIATRRCIAWLRKKRWSTKSLDALSTTELEEICYAQYETNRYEEIAVEHRCEIVTRLLKKLPECERTVVTLHYFAEMTSEEISTFLGISPNTVRSRLRRARGRLEKEESMIPEVLNSFQPNFQPSVNLTEKIMHEISQIKPNSPSISKPWIPWGLSFASTFLVILIMGFGTKALSRFHQSYSLDAISEKTIGLVDIPIVLELERKPDASTKNGRTDTPSKNSGVGFQAKRFLIAQAHAKDTDNTTAKPQWIQTKGPRGVSRTELFLTSDQNLYAIAKRGLYLLTKKKMHGH